MHVAVLNASPRARHADAALRETLRTMSAVIVEEASIALPLVGSGLSENGILDSTDIAPAIVSALRALQDALMPHPAGSHPSFPTT